MSLPPEVCICDSFGAQNIHCLAPFHHTNSEDEFEVIDYDIGSEHDIVAVISIPSNKTQHDDQAESILNCFLTDEQLLDACVTNKGNTNKTQQPIGTGDATQSLYSSSPTPPEPLGRGYIPDNYREHFKQSDEDEHTQCSRSVSTGHTPSVHDRDCERTGTVGNMLRNIDLATSEHCTVTESRKGSIVTIGARGSSRTQHLQ